MAVIINKLVTGSMGVGTSEVLDLTKTRFTLQDGTVETHNITGTLDQQWMIDNGYLDENEPVWLKTITQADIGNTVTSIGDYAFSDCSSLTNVTIGNGVESIGAYAFATCPGLTNVTIPDSVISIYGSAFQGCTGLKSVTIGKGVTSIQEYVFQFCSGLTSVTIPDSVTSIGEGTFSQCIGLTTMTFNSFVKNQVKSMTTEDYIFSGVFYDPDTYEDFFNRRPIAKSFTAVCKDGSMTINFSADDPATITFTDL